MYSPMRRNTRKHYNSTQALSTNKQTNKQKSSSGVKRETDKTVRGNLLVVSLLAVAYKLYHLHSQKGPRNERIHLRTAEVTTSCCFKRLNIKLTFLLTTKSNEFPCQTRTHSSTRLFRFDGLCQAYKTSDTQNADCGVSTVSTSQRPAVIAAVRGHVIGYSWIDWQCQ